jgi:capsular exopolysaccharide synthesis family protein
VLLIDCNFRRPGLRRAFPELRPEGLSNILVGQGKAEELIHQSSVPNLDLLGSGPMPPTPWELLGSRYMQELIALVKSKYDRVLLDGPPALLVSDALVLARLVDGVILVAQASENTKGALRRAREQLLRINARVQGAILNGVRAQPGGYYREQYREFYEYGAEETIPPELPGTFNSGTSDPK